jgi:hypothetical protein
LNIAAIYSYASASLLVGAAVSLLPIRARRSVGFLAAATASITLAPALSGLFGTPSFTLTQISLLQLFGYEQFLKERTAALLLVVFGTIFYPLALGLSTFDPFDIGYRPRPLLFGVALLGLYLAARGKLFLIVILGFDLMAYAGGIFDNFWNALFDPLLVLFSVSILVKAVTRDKLVPLSKS